MKQIILALLVGATALASRLPNLGEFMTADEGNWMVRSGEFWHKLIDNKDAGGTFITTHPGVVTMWIAGAGVYAQEIRRDIVVDEGTLRYFRKAAVLPLAIVTAGLVGIVAFLAMRLFGTTAGSVASVLLALDPYLTGMSQIVHLDALLGLTMLASILLILLFIRTRETYHLALAGVFAGLALGNKLVLGVWVIVFAIALFVIRYKTQWRQTVRNSFFLVGVSAVTFYAVWPALWVKPDLGVSLQRDIANVATQEHVAVQESSEPVSPISFYLRTVISRTTPLSLVVTSVFFVWLLWRAIKNKRLSNPLLLTVYALLFLLLITLAAKKADRYALPALVVVPLLTGVAVEQVTRRFLTARKSWIYTGALTGVVLISAVSLVTSYPYPIAYNNILFPNVRSLTQQGWGEGLDAAARWLNQNSLAPNLHVASWYPTVLGSYFDGKTLSLSSRDDRRVAYVITYRNMESRSEEDTASNVLDEVKGREPVHIEYIHNVPYVWIYETDNLALYYKHVGEITGSVEVGQIIPVETDTLNAIDIGFATFSGRSNTHDVLLEVYESPEATSPIRTAVANASQIENESWYRFTFNPIEEAKGRTLYIAVRSPLSVNGDAVTVRYADADVAPGEMIFFREALNAGQEKREFIRAGDIAYRIPAPL